MNRAFIFIMIGATLWGTISFFVKNLYEYGFTAMAVVTIRAVTAAIILVVYILILLFKLFTYINYFIVTFYFIIIFINFRIFIINEITAIPDFSTLLYTASALVIGMSFLFFHEKITTYKLIALFFS